MIFFADFHLELCDYYYILHCGIYNGSVGDMLLVRLQFDSSTNWIKPSVHTNNVWWARAERMRFFFFSQHVKTFSQLPNNCIANPIKYFLG